MSEPIHDPVHRTTYTFQHDGENLIVDTQLDPGGALPEHFHPVQTEHWSVVEGEVRFQLGDAKRVIGPADGEMLVAPNVRHSLESTGTVAQLRCRVEPAGKLEEFLTDSAAAARDGVFSRGGLPKSLSGARWAATFIQRHRDETVMTFPPQFAQRAMIALLARRASGGDRLAPMAAELQELLAGGSFYESPRWHEGRWWVSDFYRREVLAISPSGDRESVMTVEGQPSGIGWMPDGSMLVVSMKDRRVLRRSPEGEVSLHADVSEHCGGNLNDIVVDSNGRAYAGNFGFDLMAMADPAPANLIRIDPDGAVSIAADELMFPNGSVITPDGRTLVVGETAASRYTAWTIGADGALSDRRVWAQVAPAPEIGPIAETLAALQFGPDGCTLDAEGLIWSADEVGARLARVAEGGEIMDEIAAPEGLNFFASALGGDDGRTMLIVIETWGRGENVQSLGQEPRDRTFSV